MSHQRVSFLLDRHLRRYDTLRLLGLLEIVGLLLEVAERCHDCLHGRLGLLGDCGALHDVSRPRLHHLGIVRCRQRELLRNELERRFRSVYCCLACLGACCLNDR